MDATTDGTISTVEGWFKWYENEEEPTVEDIYRSLTDSLGWECTDVLYSFPGIYTIGLLAFYSMEFYLTDGGRAIKPYSNQKQLAYSHTFLSENYSKYGDLNELKELKEFLKRYKKLGNVCPIWPGGNTDRGCNGVYDLPEFYFKRYPQYPRWTSFLIGEYRGAHMEPAIDLTNKKTIKDFLDKMEGNEGEYIKFLSRICGVIDEREKAILRFARERGIDTSVYQQPDKGA